MDNFVYHEIAKDIYTIRTVHSVHTNCCSLASEFEFPNSMLANRVTEQDVHSTRCQLFNTNCPNKMHEGVMGKTPAESWKKHIRLAVTAYAVLLFPLAQSHTI